MCWGSSIAREAERFLHDLRERFGRFGLSLHPDKTRLIEFGRFAAERRRRRGQGKPETFDFLGFTHISGKTRRGRFTIRRQTIASRLRAKLRSLRERLRRRWHEPPATVGAWLGSVVRGWFAYFAVPGNFPALRPFRDQACWHWLRALRRRGQRRGLPWKRFAVLTERWRPRVQISHDYRNQRFYAKHPRREPYALAAPVRICAGGRRVTGVPTATPFTRGGPRPARRPAATAG